MDDFSIPSWKADVVAGYLPAASAAGVLPSSSLFNSTGRAYPPDVAALGLPRVNFQSFMYTGLFLICMLVCELLQVVELTHTAWITAVDPTAEYSGPMRKSPAGFIILEVTAEVKINTKLKIRLLNFLVKRKVITRQFQFQREIYGILVISLPTHPFIFSSS